MSRVIKGTGTPTERPPERPPANRIPPRAVPPSGYPAPSSGYPASSRPGGVISRDEVEARSKVDEILQQAQMKAEEIRSKAEDYRQMGYEAGYQEGFEAGKAQLTETILELNRATEDKFKQFEPELVRLAVKIAEKIIGHQAAINPDLVVQIVGKALGSVRHQREIYLRVNAEDYETLAANKPVLLDRLSRAQDIDIRPDPNIPRGGCRIESEIGTVEASVDKQLAAIERVLLGSDS